MSIKYEGKSPNKFWYIWQNTKGIAHSFSDPATKKDAKAGAKSTGMSSGVLVGGGVLTKIGFIAILPLVPTVLTIAAVGAAGYFGLNAYRKFKLVKNSATQRTYIQRQEQKWLDKKARAPLLTRLKNALRKKLDAIPRPLLLLAKWGGAAAAVTGFVASGAVALNALGVAAFSSSPTALAVAGSIAKAGALVGLTAAGATAAVATIAVIAVPVGIALALTAKKIAYRTNPDRLGFGVRNKPSAEAEAPQQSKTTPEPKPAAKPQAAAPFNDNAPVQQAKPQEKPAPKDDGLSEERKKAAAERAAARKRTHGKRFG